MLTKDYFIYLIYFSMVNTKYNTTRDMIMKLKCLNDESKLIFCQNSRNFYDEMNYRTQSGYFQFKEDYFDENAQGSAKIMDEVFLLLMIYLQTTLQVKSLNLNFYGLFYTLIKKRGEREEEKKYDNIYDNVIDHTYHIAAIKNDVVLLI